MVFNVITKKSAYQLMTSAYLFYDAPTAPSGVFDDFLAIPTLMNTVTTQSMADMVRNFAEPYRAPRYAWLATMGLI